MDLVLFLILAPIIESIIVIRVPGQVKGPLCLIATRIFDFFQVCMLALTLG